MRLRVVLCLLPVVAVSIPSQHLVGPGGLPQISSALAVAAPGATIHVLPGTYQPFTVAIGCTIRALTPGSVTIAPGPTAVPTIVAPPAGHAVHIVGLHFTDAVTWGGTTVSISSGRVTLDQCSLTSPVAAPLRIQGATVHLQSCTVSANGHLGMHAGMQAGNAHVTAIDSTFQGSPIQSLPHPTGRPAVDLVGSTFHASGCNIFSGVEINTPAVTCVGGQVWLSDSTLVSTSWGCEISAFGASVLVDRCSPASGVCAPPGGLLGVSRSQPLQNGGPFALTWHTAPNGYAAMFASQELDVLTIPGLHAQTQWLGGAGIINLGIVFADAQGHANASWAIPAGTWLIDHPLWFQGLTGFALPLQLSPVAGGVIR